MAYSSQGNRTGQLVSANDRPMEVRRDEIFITHHQVHINTELLNQIRYFSIKYLPIYPH